MATIYAGIWDKKEDIIDAFDLQPDALDNIELLYAEYEAGSYDGQACVIFKKDDKLFGVYADHCSCNDLEGQWDPEETTWQELLTYIEPGEDDDFAKFVTFNANMN